MKKLLWPSVPWFWFISKTQFILPLEILIFLIKFTLSLLFVFITKYEGSNRNTLFPLLLIHLFPFVNPFGRVSPGTLHSVKPSLTRTFSFPESEVCFSVCFLSLLSTIETFITIPTLCVYLSGFPIL